MSRKVIAPFYCMQEKVSYAVGDTYKGNRKDLNAFLEPAPKTKKTTKK